MHVNDRSTRTELDVQISIVAPIYNEEKNLNMFLQRVANVMEEMGMTYEIICINDGSTDATLEKLLSYRETQPAIKIINFSRNFGKEAALTAGLRCSRGQAVVPIDTDLQDPPEMIEDLVKKWRQGYDVVYAVRSKRHGETFMKRLTASLFYRAINLFSETPIPKNTGDFRLMDRRVVEVLNRIPERTRFMKGLFAWVGFKQAGLSYDRDPRYLGKTKWNFWKLWNFALDGIILFSTAGLKIWSYVGFVFSFLSFCYASFLIILTLAYGKDVPGYASIMVAVLFLGGLQLLSLGIIGEYLGRVYAEVKGRPLFVVKDLYGFKAETPEPDHGRDHLS